MADSFTFDDLHYPADGSVVDHIDLSVGRTERMAIFGPNGAGKTTLLRLVAGTAPGTIRRTDVAYLPQQPHLFRGTVGWNASLGGVDQKAASALMRELRVDHLVGRAASSVSGGEAQRVALARTLAVPAPIVALDEPLAPIDRVDRHDVIETIRRATSDRALVCVTHSTQDAAALAESVVIVDDGAVLQRGTLQEVSTMPASARVGEIVGIGNVLRGEVVASDGDVATISVGQHRMVVMGSASIGADVVVRFDAASVAVFAELPSSASHRTIINGLVGDVVERGQLIELVLDGDPPIVAMVTTGALDALGVHVGSRVWFGIKAASVEVIRS